jgi:hypothetical protein
MLELCEKDISARYKLNVLGTWIPEALVTLNDACNDLIKAFAGRVPLWMRGLKVSLEEMSPRGLASRGLIRLNPINLTKWTIIHEIGHACDFSFATLPSFLLQKSTHSSDPFVHARKTNNDPKCWYIVGSPPAPCGVDRNFNRLEDFAESFAALVYPELAREKAEAMKNLDFHYSTYGYGSFRETPRGRFMQKLINI